MSKVEVRVLMDIPEYTEERVPWFIDILKFIAKILFEIRDSDSSPVYMTVNKVSEHEWQEGLINPFNKEDRD